MIFVDKDTFEKILHGNRSVKLDDVIVGKTYNFMCNDIEYSYPVSAKIKSYYPGGDVFKTNKAVRTSEFPFE